MLLIGVGALLVNINTRKQEARADRAGRRHSKTARPMPAVWGQNFPHEYSRFLMMEDDTVPTAYGGSQQYDKLARFPAMKRLWNGYAFAVDYNEERSHFYALIDQKETERQVVVKQPGACANCHSGDAPNLIKSMGWEAFNHTPYNEISEQAAHRHHLQRLPRPRDDGAARSRARPSASDGEARHRRDQGHAPGDAHLRLRPVPRRVLLPGRQQDC